MEYPQALRIVSALAGGTNPLTGEVFPPDSPYQSPDIIRALFAAARALENCAQPATHASPRPNASANAPRSPASGNAGKPWSADEDRQLLAAFDAGKPLADLAQIHGRTHGGVRARLEKHGRLEPSPTTRWPVGKAQQASPGRNDQPASTI